MKNAYKDCFKNADKYLEDSITLKERSSGRASALAILGQEEVGKGLLNYLIRVLETLGETKLAKEWRQEIFRHETKLTLVQMLSFVQSLTTVEMKKAMAEMPNLKAKARRSRDPFAVAAQYLSKIYPSIEQQASIEAPKALDIAFQLNELKKRGLYVDPLQGGGSISTPDEISQADAEEQIRKLKEGREMVGKIMDLLLKHPKKFRLMGAQAWLKAFKQHRTRQNGLPH
ncbi:MAG: hypothetical protein CEE41_01695 [Hadesarchaea archaeon B3_Hades]|nr:MAG: hypothetical protein CEE41_01695 [Hadesarchaea archaeon B3_Hades]